MTPLAQQIVSELTLPLSRRTFIDKCGLLRRLPDAHCFDVDAVYDAAIDLGQYLYEELTTLVDDGRRRFKTDLSISTKDLAFLPAPLTWLEWKDDKGVRNGCLLESLPEGHLAIVDWAWAAPFVSAAAINSEDTPGPRAGLLQLNRGFEKEGLTKIPGAMMGVDSAVKFSQTLRLWALLAIINSPRVIGRKTYAPHAGLQRNLSRAFGKSGKYPLHAWTEITLEVLKPKISDETLDEVYLSGKRALHFCRAHLRIKQGRLEHVRAHWRGDPALGMRRTRYRVTA